MTRSHSIGIAGTGFIGRGLLMAMDFHPDLPVRKVLTRRSPADCTDHPRRELLTNSTQELIDHCEVIVECSGDVLHATEVVDQALKAGRIVVTMDAEFQVTTGSYFVGKGTFTEAQGDQPGSLAAFGEDIRLMGFVPLVYGNRKGYYNADPPLDQMEFWSKKQGISLDQVTGFTDGTKVQIEQALVANGLGATIAQDGMMGLEAEDLVSGGMKLVEHAQRIGKPISDYVVAPKAPAGIFIVATNDERQKPYLEYLKLGIGPHYVLVHPYHLCHLEIVTTIRRMLDGKPALLTNSTHPEVSVCAIAKRELKRGDSIKKGIGSFVLRGEAVRMTDHAGHIPIGLVADAVVARNIQPGQRLTIDDVEIPDSLALRAWKEINQRVS